MTRFSPHRLMLTDAQTERCEMIQEKAKERNAFAGAFANSEKCDMEAEIRECSLSFDLFFVCFSKMHLLPAV